MPKAFPWKDEYYVAIYQQARDGASLKEVAGRLGVNYSSLCCWMRDKPALKAAMREAKRTPGSRSREGYETFREFVYGHLPEDAQVLWNSLDEIDTSPGPNTAERRVRRKEALNLITARGTRIRQHIFLYALIHCDFMHSIACQKAGVPAATLQTWMERDPAFRSLVDGIHMLKKDFFEAALVRLVRNGDSAATLFSNRTVNRDRGYGDRAVVEVNQSVEHKHQITVDDLSPELLEALLEATRRKKTLQIEVKPVTVAE